jgi:urease accessory protein
MRKKFHELTLRAVPYSHEPPTGSSFGEWPSQDTHVNKLRVQCQIATESSKHWKARLDLEILKGRLGTQLGRRSHRGPLRIQRPFYPEGPETIHVYLLHPPGGIVGGDSLEIGIDVGVEAKAVITTPAAQKLYRSASEECRLKTEINLGSRAQLEWLPTETITFDGAKVVSSQRVNLASGAQFIGWEMGCFGRPASGIEFEHGRVTFHFEIYRESSPLLVERTNIAGGSATLRDPWGYAGLAAFGSLYCVCDNDAQLENLACQFNNHCQSCPDTRAAATRLEELVVLRVHAASLQTVRAFLIRAWHIARPIMLGRSAHEPRIWAT